jgi:sigma-E factor negative regulatory protein RseA
LTRARAIDGDGDFCSTSECSKSYLECLMSNDFATQPAVDERLSALTDGELDAQSAAAACADWRDDESARERWHAYQLIGDVLRSEDLASTATKDSAFLLALRARLADEPVVLAPQPLPSAVPDPIPVSVGSAAAGTSKRAWGWLAPAAVAAGFVAVAGSLTVMWAPLKSSDSSTSLAITAPPRAQAVSASASEVDEPQVLVANGQVIRDPRLDRYLAAHKQFAGAAMLGVPSAFVRSAAAEAPKP